MSFEVKKTQKIVESVTEKCVCLQWPLQICVRVCSEAECGGSVAEGSTITGAQPQQQRQQQQLNADLLVDFCGTRRTRKSMDSTTSAASTSVEDQTIVLKNIRRDIPALKPLAARVIHLQKRLIETVKRYQVSLRVFSLSVF